MARENYPEIRKYDLIAETEQYSLSNAAMAWVPQVVLSGQATYQTATATLPKSFGQMGLTGMAKDQYKVAVDVTQNIWDGGQSKASRAMATAESREQDSRTDVALYALRSRVDDLYFGILLLEERKAQTEETIKVLESNLRRMRTYYNNGVAMRSDVDAVEADLLTAKQQLNQVEASRASFRQMLELFIGKQLSCTQLKRPDATGVADRTVARPELNMFGAQLGTISAQRKQLSASLMPRVSAFAQGFYGYPGLDMFENMKNSDLSWNAIVGVRMQWNIGSLYTKKNNIGKLDAAKRRVDVERDIFLFNTQLQTVQLDGEIVRLQKALEHDERIVELRRSVRKSAESKLENGVIDATDLLRKIAEENTAQLNKSAHEIELLQTIYRLKTTLNQ